MFRWDGDQRGEQAAVCPQKFNFIFPTDFPPPRPWFFCLCHSHVKFKLKTGKAEPKKQAELSKALWL